MSTRRRITRTFTGALLAIAVAAPAAGARPIDVDLQRHNPPPLEQKPTVTRTIDAGIDVGSAAIGAGGASAVLLLAAAGAVTALHRRRRVGILD